MSRTNLPCGQSTPETSAPQDGPTFSRRALLTRSAVAASLALVARPAQASVCLPTPAQGEGPFYPVAKRLEDDNDLTWRHDREHPALGEVIEMEGQVTDTACKPLPHVLVEIWQACASGRYDHPADDNTAPLDANFQYWGRTVTDDAGNYRFRTIKPGAYPDSPSWTRPPHIHVRAHRRGYGELTTQMYFAGDRYNADDRVLRRLSAAEQARVVVAPVTGGPLPVYRFDLSLASV